MPYLPNIIDAIGNTPLIKLRKVSEMTGCTILGKAEFLNPGQSVKDRAALGIIRDAEAKGQLKQAYRPPRARGESSNTVAQMMRGELTAPDPAEDRRRERRQPRPQKPQ